LAKNYIFVTEDEGSAKLAKEKGAKYIFLDTVMKVKAVRQECEARYARELHN
jgi:predicted PilT family ATPase